MRRLLIRPGAIGDVILSIPELEQSRAEYTEIWAQRAVLPLLRFADRARAIVDTGLDLVGVVEDARVPELETFDSIYSWYGANHPEFRDAVRHLPFEFFPALPIVSKGIPRIDVPAGTVEDIAVIHPFSGSPKKNWPLESFRAVASRLELPARWCAGPEEILDPALTIDPVRIADLYQLAIWLSRTRVYIGNDSGITHLAAAAGTPVVAIFLTTDPAIWAPRGARVIVLQNPTVDQVVDAARRAISLR